MSTLTGNDVMGLMEAYQAVYAPQELTEEQVWEEVEEWVNTLIEEGYDLSDYTWEEMFDVYIEEQSKEANMATWAKANPKLAAAAAERERTRGTSATTNPLMKDLKSRLPAPKPAAAPSAAPAAPKPAPAAPKPAPAAAKPAPSAAPSAAPPRASTRRRPGQNSNISPITKSVQKFMSSAPSGSGARRGAAPMPTLKQSYEYDAYDLVLEYLLSQGHADTLEEANYVMLELDAEIIGDIVEVMTPPVKAPPKTAEGKKVPQITGDGKGKPMGGPYKD